MNLDATAFHQAARAWLAEVGELVLLVRRPFAAAARDYHLLTDPTRLQSPLDAQSVGTCVIAFRSAQLALRGVAGPALFQVAKDTILDGRDVLLLRCAPSPTDAGRDEPSDYRIVRTRRELEDAMNDAESRGYAVALGPEPPWWTETEEVLAWYVGDVAAAY